MEKLKKINFMKYLSIIYIALSVIFIFKYESLANSLYSSYQEYDSLKDFVSLSFCQKYIILLSIIGIIINLIILYNKNKSSKLIRTLSIINLFIAINTIQNLIAIFDVLIAFNFISHEEYIETPKEKKKTKIPIIIYNRPNIKEILGSVFLLLFYFAFDIFGNKIISNENGYMVVTTIFYVIMVCLCFIIFEKEILKAFDLFKKHLNSYIIFIRNKVLIGYLIEIIASLIAFLIIGMYTSANQDALSQMPFIYVCITAILFAPFVEEILFRGCLRRFIKNDIAFIIISGIIFGLLHTISEANLLRIIVIGLPYISLGCVLAYSYVKSNNIFTNIGMHMTINTISCILMFLIK